MRKWSFGFLHSTYSGVIVPQVRTSITMCNDGTLETILFGTLDFLWLGRGSIFFNLTDHSSPDLNLLRLRALFFVVRFAS